MKQSFHALASLMASLSGSVAAVSHCSCPVETAAQNTVDMRAVCGFHLPQLALLTGSFSGVPETLADESAFFEITAAVPEHRYEDSCGRDLRTGEIYNCQVAAPTGPTETLSPLGTCEIPSALEVERAARSISSRVKNAISARADVASESLADLWQQIQPLWTNAWEGVSSESLVRSPIVRRKGVPGTPIVVLREDENAALAANASQEYALAEDLAAREALPAVAPQLPAVPLPNQLSYEDEYQSGYEIAGPDPDYGYGEYLRDNASATDEDDNAESIDDEWSDDEWSDDEWKDDEWKDEDAGADEDASANGLAEEEWSDDAEGADAAAAESHVEYDWENALSAEAGANAEGRPARPLFRPIWQMYDDIFSELEVQVDMLEARANEVRHWSSDLTRAGRDVAIYAEELKWERDTQVLDAIFNEYCSLVEFDNLIMGVRHDRSWKDGVVNSLRSAGNWLLDVAEQIDDVEIRRPFYSARQSQEK